MSPAYIFVFVLFVPLATSMSLPNALAYCRFHPAGPSLPAGVDCVHECTPVLPKGMLCSFNLTEACNLEWCPRSAVSFSLPASHLMNSIPERLGLTNMLRLADPATFRYKACLLPASVSHDDIPFKHRAHCRPCIVQTRLNLDMSLTLMCTGFERYRAFQTAHHNNIVLGLEMSSQYTPINIFTIGAQFYHLPNADNQTIGSVRYIGNMNLYSLDVLAKLFVYYH